MAHESEAQLLFFATPAEFRSWLAKNHEWANELWVGYYHKDSGRPSMTWPQSVDEALCFSWIDGIRKKVDDVSYKVRFTPRRAKSTWSKLNIERVAALRAARKMHAAGRAAFARREENSRKSSVQNRESAKLGVAEQREFRRHAAAWQFYLAQPPGYRRLTTWWIIRAKRPDTRRKRLQRLIDESRARRRMFS